MAGGWSPFPHPEPRDPRFAAGNEPTEPDGVGRPSGNSPLGTQPWPNVYPGQPASQTAMSDTPTPIYRLSNRQRSISPVDRLSAARRAVATGMPGMTTGLPTSAATASAISLAGGRSQGKAPPFRGAGQPDVESDAPAPIPGNRIFGTGLMTGWQAREKKEKAVTLAIGSIALVVMLISALLLFDPFPQRDAFGFSPGTHVIVQHSNDIRIVANGTGATPTPPPTPSPTATPQATPTPTSAPGSSGGPAPVPSATPIAAPSATAIPAPSATSVPSATPTPTPTATATATPTPTPTPAPLDGANITGNSGNMTRNPGTSFPVSFTVANTGNTTWTSGAGYVLVCEANCFGAGTQAISGSVAPGQSVTFTIGMSTPGGNILNQNFYSQTTTWQMQHNGAVFGNQSSLTVSVHGWQTVYGPLTPCPGSSGWVKIVATAGCGYLQTSSTYYPEMDLQVTPASTSQFRMEAHVHLTVGGASNYAGSLIIDTPQGPSSFGGLEFGIESNGQWTLWQCCTSGGYLLRLQSGSVGASQDYDLQIVVSGGTLYCYINGGQITTVSTSANLKPGPDQGLIQWIYSQNNNDASDWSNFQIAGWG